MKLLSQKSFVNVSNFWAKSHLLKFVTFEPNLICWSLKLWTWISSCIQTWIKTKPQASVYSIISLLYKKRLTKMSTNGIELARDRPIGRMAFYNIIWDDPIWSFSHFFPVFHIFRIMKSGFSCGPCQPAWKELQFDRSHDFFWISGFSGFSRSEIRKSRFFLSWRDPGEDGLNGTPHVVLALLQS